MKEYWSNIFTTLVFAELHATVINSLTYYWGFI